MATTKKFIGERYPNLKITMAKVVIGGIAVTSFKLLHTDHVQAATTKGNQVSNSSSIYYQVSSGDTLSKIANKYHTSSNNIKQANHLKSDVIKVNQLLIIPKAFHKVQTGDYLTVLAKKYGTTAAAIKEANGLKSDVTYIGQTLIIPILIQGQLSTSNSTAFHQKANNL
ncbi:LysM peptidoglycan-binding domain-containing protein [Heyndrickxia ginsengihumi]|uniref:LysM peptidoglycan-binding domain-containing protein n=1 Tax=Heyndrickxia ginsengihumi TaxID=363870 RepID=UPI003D1E9476